MKLHGYLALGDLHNYLGHFKSEKVLGDGHNTNPKPKEGEIPDFEKKMKGSFDYEGALEKAKETRKQRTEDLKKKNKEAYGME